jgi:hypothetical protein
LQDPLHGVQLPGAIHVWNLALELCVLHRAAAAFAGSGCAGVGAVKLVADHSAPTHSAARPREADPLVFFALPFREGVKRESGVVLYVRRLASLERTLTWLHAALSCVDFHEQRRKLHWRRVAVLAEDV